VISTSPTVRVLCGSFLSLVKFLDH